MAVYTSPGAGRVLIATAAGPLVAEPSWTRFDNLSACRCAGFDWNRGRQSEFDVTNTGTARVNFHDRNGTFDETFVGKQIMLQLFNPEATEWQPCFRGHIDDVRQEPSPNTAQVVTVLECVDIFDYLGGVRMAVLEFGDTPPDGMNGIVFYEDGPFQTRVEALLDDAGLDSDMYQVFTGNINVLESQYDTSDDILSGVRDATDAEFPSGVAQAYVDRFGRVAVHGRLARFDPDATSATAGDAAWDFRRWDAATRGDVGTDKAQIREFAYNQPRTRIINSYLAYPRGIDEDAINGLMGWDTVSIAAYGWRGREAPDLIVKGHQTNGNSGVDECSLYVQYFIGAYAEPRKNVERVSFKSLLPTDDRAAATWALMCGADISDMLHLFVAEAGLSDEEFYIEGVAGQCRVGSPDVDFVTVTYNLSPFSYFDTNPF